MSLPLLDRTLVPRSRRPERILQFGGGNFLRGFADWVVHEMNEKLDFNAGVVVVQSVSQTGVRQYNAQDGLYTLMLTGMQDGTAKQEITVVDCIQRALSATYDFEDFLALARSESIEVVLSNTTENGIVFDKNDALTDVPPGSFPGKLTRLLYERYLFFSGQQDKGWVIIPCELIEDNGTRLKHIVLQLAETWQLQDGFPQWLEASCTFCNTLVDRIVSGYPNNAAEIQAQLGYTDELLTEGESFHLWVITASPAVQKVFPADQAGLQVVFASDIHPYRVRKVRILNGAHTAMVPLAYLYGLRTVRESVEDHLMGNFIEKLVFEEILPTLDLPSDSLRSYASDVLNRFRNPFIRHQLISIALHATAKFTTRILPSLLEYHQRMGKLPERIVLAFAAQLVFYRGVTLSGETIALNDDPAVLNFFQQVWEAHGEDIPTLVQVILAEKSCWGMDLLEVPGLAERLSGAVSDLLTQPLTDVLDRF
jgi:tagaturonate reductase